MCRRSTLKYELVEMEGYSGCCADSHTFDLARVVYVYILLHLRRRNFRSDCPGAHGDIKFASAAPPSYTKPLCTSLISIWRMRPVSSFWLMLRGKHLAHLALDILKATPPPKVSLALLVLLETHRFSPVPGSAQPAISLISRSFAVTTSTRYIKTSSVVVPLSSQKPSVFLER